MYATLGREMPAGDGWTFEPKYDGMRVIAAATARSGRLVTRNGADKSVQFPEVMAAVRELARRAGGPLTVDGEIIARGTRRKDAADGGGDFQLLQSRMHLKDRAVIEQRLQEAPVTLVVFDLLRVGRRSLLGRPWSERRAQLEEIFEGAGRIGPMITLTESTPDGAAMLARARDAGWEGVIAKRTDAPYRAGARANEWRKLKLQYRAEFVVGGFTEPRRSRPSLGAVLLGAHDETGALVYVGHAGGGFTHEGLTRMRRRLERLERRSSPFTVAPRTTEPVHWVRPEVVVEVKFAEWTADRLLRQPIVLGVRDDKAARDVKLEGVSAQRWGMARADHDAA